MRVFFSMIFLFAGMLSVFSQEINDSTELRRLIREEAERIIQEKQDSIRTVYNSWIDNRAGHYVSATVSVGAVVEDIESVWTSGNPELGFSYEVGYKWLSKKTFLKIPYGFGLNCSGYVTGGKVTNRVNGKWEEQGRTLMLNYFAPQFYLWAPLSKRFGFSINIGAGYAMANYYGKDAENKEMSEFSDGFGMNVGLNWEFFISERLQLQMCLSTISTTAGFEDNDELLFKIGDRKSSGFKVASFGAGVSYHF